MNTQDQASPVPHKNSLRILLFAVLYIAAMAYSLVKVAQLIDSQPMIALFWFGAALVVSEIILDTIDFGTSKRRFIYSTSIRVAALFAAYAALAL